MAINSHIRKSLFFFIVLFVSSSASAQLAPHKYLIRFTDKNNSPYTLSDPSQYLSAKAIARRVNQGITIKYNDLPVTPAYIDSVINTGVTLYCTSKWFNSATIFTTDSVALAKIMSFPFVQSVDSISKIMTGSLISIFPEKKNSEVVMNVRSSFTQNNYSAERTESYDYGFAYNQVSMIGLDYLHNLGYSGQGMTIAVIDAGFWHADTMAVFDSLWTNNQILGYINFVEPGGNLFGTDISTHGMMVLSIMGGNIPGQIVGTAPKANYWLLRSEDAVTENIIEEYNWASAAEFADSVGADVINSSLGYTDFDQSWMNHTYDDMDGETTPASIAATIAASKGIIVCNSAGNSGSSPWHYIGAPADADSIITVGAVDDQENYASFSSTGPSSDGRIKPTVAAQGQGTVVASTGGGIMSGNGTSFSSPVIAGATACLWQANQSYNNMMIIQAIAESSSQYTSPDSLLGYGIPNFAAANLILSGIPINDFDNTSLVNIFPNPFDDIIYIVFFSSDTQVVDIDVYDITGKKVISEKGLKRSAGYNYLSVRKVSELGKGLYIVRILSDGKIYSQKLMKA
ncbi:MAG: S8 family serine peptidase [Bacteroidota bacterium]